MNDETTERAFPVPDDASGMPGMTLRDYVAAKAMQAIAHESYRLGREFGYTQPDSLAEQAYKIADAMLKERKND